MHLVLVINEYYSTKMASTTRQVDDMQEGNMNYFY